MERFEDTLHQQEMESSTLSGAMETEEHRSIPCQCLSDMIPDFKRLVKNIADEVSDISKLTFMCDMEHTGGKGDKLKALDVLWKQVQKGRFAHDNVSPLESLLKDIDRCDLVKYVVPYKQKYGEHAVTGGLQKSDSAPSWSNSPVPMKRTSSALSLPASTASWTSPYTSQSSLTTGVSQRKAHTDPGAQRAQHNMRSRAKAQMYVAGKRSQHCTTVPEEESSSVGNASRQPLSLQLAGEQYMHVVPSFSLQAPLQQKRERHRSDVQGKSYHDSRCQTPSTLNEQYSLPTSATNTPTRSKRSSSNMRPSSSLSMGEERQLQVGYMHLGSTTPRASLSTPASEQWSAPLDPDSYDEREPSFPHSELEHSGGSNSLNLPSHGTGLSHPYLHSSGYPHDGETHSACSNPFPSGHHSADYPYTEYPVHSSLPTLIQPRYHSQNQFGQRPQSLYHQSQQLGGFGGGQSTRAPRTHTKNFTWEISRKCLLSGIQKLGRPLKDRVNFVLPVGCRMKKNPRVSLSVVPCENRESRHVAIEGELIIPRACSRHKWLVEYCACSVHMSVRVTNPRTQQELGNNSADFNITHSEVDCDHRTCLKVERVLEHEVFLYNASVAKFRFHVNVQLFEHQFRPDLTVQYECKECDDDFTEISLLCVPSQVASLQ